MMMGETEDFGYPTTKTYSKQRQFLLNNPPPFLGAEKWNSLGGGIYCKVWKVLGLASIKKNYW
jgi:hypothetical protein